MPDKIREATPRKVSSGRDLPLLPVGKTFTRHGEMCVVAAVLMTGGERYYHLLHLDGSIEMVPAVTLAEESPNESLFFRLGV